MRKDDKSIHCCNRYTLLKAKGHVWHKSSMNKGIVPRSGIDTDARWGFSHAKGWIFGYKLHMISILVPL